MRHLEKQSLNLDSGSPPLSGTVIELSHAREKAFAFNEGVFIGRPGTASAARVKTDRGDDATPYPIDDFCTSPKERYPQNGFVGACPPRRRRSSVGAEKWAIAFELIQSFPKGTAPFLGRAQIQAAGEDSHKNAQKSSDHFSRAPPPLV